MVKVTIVGRMSDGLPLAQGLRYMNEEYAYLSCYRQQAEFILQEISRGALIASKMTIHFTISASNGIIANISRQYIDTRTQANLSKLNANRKQDVDVASQDFYDIVERKRNSETMRRLPVTPQPESTIWCSPRLEAIALEWTPIMILVITSMALLWATLVLTDDFIISMLVRIPHLKTKR
ncbi:uncharacterized protein HKW66_Vig0194060 [Vigna angularis]|uniref:Uncharacterized protein n=1 Tax=Phaseolus angularis TaxID=3914 RepID=A0A8T0KR36_PHAAN|nr:uncharacterized protein HKW66_Vig0194060 [Vigna angularis]